MGRKCGDPRPSDANSTRPTSQMLRGRKVIPKTAVACSLRKPVGPTDWAACCLPGSASDRLISAPEGDVRSPVPRVDNKLRHSMARVGVACITASATIVVSPYHI